MARSEVPSPSDVPVTVTTETGVDPWDKTDHPPIARNDPCTVDQATTVDVADDVHIPPQQEHPPTKQEEDAPKDAGIASDAGGGVDLIDDEVTTWTRREMKAFRS